jgi:hypothetical protein
MPFYLPVQNARAFRRMTRYDQVNWNNFNEVVDAFHARIDDWYLLPTKELINHKDGGHYAFAIMALNCLLIDTLSQFYYGADLSPSERRDSFPEASKAKFQDYLVAQLSHRTGPLPTKIESARGNLLTFEDVLYSGFRCGILHQAHVPLYGGIAGEPGGIVFEAAGKTKYADGRDCPTVVCFPQKLFEDIETVFLKYLVDLKNPDPAFTALRRRFKAKFEDSFGVTINTTI